MVAVATTAETLRSPFWLHDAQATVRAVDALVAVGVVDALSEKPSTSDELADSLGLARRPLDLALDVASSVGLLTVDATRRWHADPIAVRMIPSVSAMTATLRGKEPERDVSDTADAIRTYVDLVAHIGHMAGAMAPALVPTMRKPGQTVLELAAGASPWGRALCADDPTTTITAVDLEHVIDSTRRAVDADGFADRYRFVESDVFELDGVPPADLVVIAGLCRLLGGEQNQELFARASRWCTPGGRVAIIDAVSTVEARAAGLSGYELGLLTRTSRGRCWSLEHYARWLADAGFVRIEIETTARPEISLVTAWRNETHD